MILIDDTNSIQAILYHEYREANVDILKKRFQSGVDTE